MKIEKREGVRVETTWTRKINGKRFLFRVVQIGPGSGLFRATVDEWRPSANCYSRRRVLVFRSPKAKAPSPSAVKLTRKTYAEEKCFTGKTWSLQHRKRDCRYLKNRKVIETNRYEAWRKGAKTICVSCWWD